jgi:plastocyanin
MSVKKMTLLAVAAGLVAVAPAAGGSTTTVTISHEMRGCHMWQVGGGKLAPSIKVTLAKGATLRFVNNDIMPHRLMQLAGPKLALVHPNMNRLSAVSTAKLTRAGTYRFTTKPGEDYKMFAGHKTIGEDYVLRLTVSVK